MVAGAALPPGPAPGMGGGSGSGGETLVGSSSHNLLLFLIRNSEKMGLGREGTQAPICPWALGTVNLIHSWVLGWGEIGGGGEDSS